MDRQKEKGAEAKNKQIKLESRWATIRYRKCRTEKALLETILTEIHQKCLKTRIEKMKRQT